MKLDNIAVGKDKIVLNALPLVLALPPDFSILQLFQEILVKLQRRILDRPANRQNNRIVVVSLVPDFFGIHPDNTKGLEQRLTETAHQVIIENRRRNNRKIRIKLVQFLASDLGASSDRNRGVSWRQGYPHIACGVCAEAELSQSVQRHDTYSIHTAPGRAGPAGSI